MNGSLFDRISKIIAGGVDGLLSGLENKGTEASLTSAIEEVEKALEDVRSQLAGVVTRKHLANKKLVSKNNEHESISSQVELAISESREDLAKAGVSKQLDIEAQIPIIEQTIHECKLEEKELEGYIFALKARIKEMEQDLESLKEVNREAESVVPPNKEMTNTIDSKVSKASKSFDNAYSDASGLHGMKAEQIKDRAKMQELENLQRERMIQDRIDSLKK